MPSGFTWLNHVLYSRSLSAPRRCSNSSSRIALSLFCIVLSNLTRYGESRFASSCDTRINAERIPAPCRAVYQMGARSGIDRSAVVNGTHVTGGTRYGTPARALYQSCQQSARWPVTCCGNATISPMGSTFDVVVVGGGHAGIEAAHAAARLGASVALVIQNPDRLGVMPCNPAIGGPGKSQMVFELVALGGVMGQLADGTAINTRVLNASRGPAVQSLRVQNDRDEYATAARDLITSVAGVQVIRGEVASLKVAGGRVTGAELTDGRVLRSLSVVLCTGTFL